MLTIFNIMQTYNDLGDREDIIGESGGGEDLCIIYVVYGEFWLLFILNGHCSSRISTREMTKGYLLGILYLEISYILSHIPGF